jgi:hypothetical protein
VIWRYSVGYNSTQVNPSEYEGYTEFERLSVERGVSLDLTP